MRLSSVNQNKPGAGFPDQRKNSRANPVNSFLPRKQRDSAESIILAADSRLQPAIIIGNT